MQELVQLSKTDWILESERKQRLSDRSLHHIVYQAGVVASLPIPVHPYMLRRSGLYYRAALLLQGANLSLHECCLLWNYYATSSAIPASAQIEYQAINRKREETFLLVLTKSKLLLGLAPMKISSIIFWVLICCLPLSQKFLITTGLLLLTGICELCRKHLGLIDNIFIVVISKCIIVSNTFILIQLKLFLRCKTPPFRLHLIPSLPNF